jgi:hypothetical protein
MRDEFAEVSVVEIKSDDKAVSELLSIEELETRMEMAGCSRCCAESAPA